MEKAFDVQRIMKNATKDGRNITLNYREDFLPLLEAYELKTQG